MADYLDNALGEVVEALKEKESGSFWANTLLVFHSDNGGEILAAGTCGGNNW
jgi:arylsulfatase A-like enzyme